MSRGPVPDVSGMSIGQATSTLEGVGLEVAEERGEQFSDTVDKGKVVGLSGWDDSQPLRPGDTVSLVVSKGPEPVTVPDVAGMNLRDAVAALENAGFDATTNVPELVWSLFQADSTSPAAGTTHPRGTTVQIRASG